MLASIFILIMFLPAAILPVVLDTFASSADLDEMGISLENSDDTFPMQGYELVGVLSLAQNVTHGRSTNRFRPANDLSMWIVKTPPVIEEFLFSKFYDVN